MRKHTDRFNGVSEEQLYAMSLNDIVDFDLDILFVNINPGLYSVFKQHHYSGPGNHFWRCLYDSGLTNSILKSTEDLNLIRDYRMGLMNMQEKASKKSCQELTNDEIRDASNNLVRKICHYRPKIVAFNGKTIFEIYTGCSVDKQFDFGKQAATFANNSTDSLMFVMPSSSARCSQLPKVADKVPFYAALKKLRDHLRNFNPGSVLTDAQITFPDFKVALEVDNHQEKEKEKAEEDLDDLDDDGAVEKDKPTSNNNKIKFVRLNNMTYSQIPAEILENLRKQRAQRKNVTITTTQDYFQSNPATASVAQQTIAAVSQNQQQKLTSKVQKTVNNVVQQQQASSTNSCSDVETASTDATNDSLDFSQVNGGGSAGADFYDSMIQGFNGQVKQRQQAQSLMSDSSNSMGSSGAESHNSVSVNAVANNNNNYNNNGSSRLSSLILNVCSTNSKSGSSNSNSPNPNLTITNSTANNHNTPQTIRSALNNPQQIQQQVQSPRSVVDMQYQKKLVAAASASPATQKLQPIQNNNINTSSPNANIMSRVVSNTPEANKIKYLIANNSSNNKSSSPVVVTTTTTTTPKNNTQIVQKQQINNNNRNQISNAIIIQKQQTDSSVCSNNTILTGQQQQQQQQVQVIEEEWVTDDSDDEESENEEIENENNNVWFGLMSQDEVSDNEFFTFDDKPQQQQQQRVFLSDDYAQALKNEVAQGIKLNYYYTNNKNNNKNNENMKRKIKKSERDAKRKRKQTRKNHTFGQMSEATKFLATNDQTQTLGKVFGSQSGMCHLSLQNL